MKGPFQFMVMLFGLCNAPATFQQLMDLVLSGLQWSKCLVYTVTANKKFTFRFMIVVWVFYLHFVFGCMNHFAFTIWNGTDCKTDRSGKWNVQYSSEHVYTSCLMHTCFIHCMAVASSPAGPILAGVIGNSAARKFCCCSNFSYNIRLLNLSTATTFPRKFGHC